MTAAARTIQVDTVTLHRNVIATVFAEMDRRENGAVTLAAFSDRAFTRADTFIRVACEHAAGAVHTLTPPAVIARDPTELVIASDQERALVVLERLAEGDRFIVVEDRMGRALQHWVDEGFAGLDEEGYFLTPAGRTHAEKVLG